MSDIEILPILEFFGFENLGTRPGVKVKCVFHGDDHPSAVWYSHYFKCFACGVQGDAVRLLHDQGGLDWHEAKLRAEALAGKEHGDVRKGRQSSSTILGRAGVQRGRRPFVPFRRGA